MEDKPGGNLDDRDGQGDPLPEEDEGQVEDHGNDGHDDGACQEGIFGHRVGGQGRRKRLGEVAENADGVAGVKLVIAIPEVNHGPEEGQNHHGNGHKHHEPGTQLKEDDVEEGEDKGKTRTADQEGGKRE